MCLLPCVEQQERPTDSGYGGSLSLWSAFQWYVACLWSVVDRVGCLRVVFIYCRLLCYCCLIVLITHFLLSHTISFLLHTQQIDWNSRYLRNNGSLCLVSVDGTDFMINEPSPFDPKWFSIKFKGPGVKYEIGLCIQTGEIVWVNGPFPCGRYPDHVMVAQPGGLEDCLAAGEFYLCDGVYRNRPRSVTPTGHHTPRDRMKAMARARHETVNGRFKRFGVLRQRFRHEVYRHRPCALSVFNIIQVEMEEEYPIFQVQYYDR